MGLVEEEDTPGETPWTAIAPGERRWLARFSGGRRCIRSNRERKDGEDEGSEDVAGKAGLLTLATATSRRAPQTVVPGAGQLPWAEGAARGRGSFTSSCSSRRKAWLLLTAIQHWKQPRWKWSRPSVSMSSEMLVKLRRRRYGCYQEAIEVRPCLATVPIAPRAVFGGGLSVAADAAAKAKPLPTCIYTRDLLLRLRPQRTREQLKGQEKEKASLRVVKLPVNIFPENPQKPRRSRSVPSTRGSPTWQVPLNAEGLKAQSNECEDLKGRTQKCQALEADCAAKPGDPASRQGRVQAGAGRGVQTAAWSATRARSLGPKGTAAVYPSGDTGNALQAGSKRPNQRNRLPDPEVLLSTSQKEGQMTTGSSLGPLARQERSRSTKLQREVRALLNKISPDNEASIVSQLAALRAETSQDVWVIATLTVEKAVGDPFYSEVYARAIKQLSEGFDGFGLKPAGGGTRSGISFAESILQHCRGLFEDFFGSSRALDHESDEAEAQKHRHKASSFVRLLGHLHLARVISMNLLNDCLERLLLITEDEEDVDQPWPPKAWIECACELLATVGKDLRMSRMGQSVLKNVVDRLKVWKVVRYSDFEPCMGKEYVFPPRIQFLIQNAIEAHEHVWPSSRHWISST